MRELLRGLHLQSPLLLWRPSRAHKTYAFGEPAPPRARLPGCSELVLHGRKVMLRLTICCC